MSTHKHTHMHPHNHTHCDTDTHTPYVMKFSLHKRLKYNFFNELICIQTRQQVVQGQYSNTESHEHCPLPAGFKHLSVLYFQIINQRIILSFHKDLNWNMRERDRFFINWIFIIKGFCTFVAVRWSKSRKPPHSVTINVSTRSLCRREATCTLLSTHITHPSSRHGQWVERTC